MGNIKSQPDNTLSDAINKFSHFPPEDIVLWVNMFKKAYPTTISRDDLENAFKALFPFGNCSPFATYIFRTINISQTARIDINEFLISFSIMTKGSRFEKLRWVFRLMDSDDDGVVSRNEMMRVVQSVYDMVGCFFDVGMDAEHVVRQLFEDIENESGFMTFEDFKVLVDRKPEIMQYFIFERSK